MEGDGSDFPSFPQTAEIWARKFGLDKGAARIYFAVDSSGLIVMRQCVLGTLLHDSGLATC